MRNTVTTATLMVGHTPWSDTVPKKRINSTVHVQMHFFCFVFIWNHMNHQEHKNQINFTICGTGRKTDFAHIVRLLTLGYNWNHDQTDVFFVRVSNIQQMTYKLTKNTAVILKYVKRFIGCDHCTRRLFAGFSPPTALKETFSPLSYSV